MNKKLLPMMVLGAVLVVVVFAATAGLDAGVAGWLGLFTVYLLLWNLVVMWRNAELARDQVSLSRHQIDLSVEEYRLSQKG